MIFSVKKNEICHLLFFVCKCDDLSFDLKHAFTKILRLKVLDTHNMINLIMLLSIGYDVAVDQIQCSFFQNIILIIGIICWI